MALRRLGDRVDRLYRQEQTDTLSLLLSSTSFTDALDLFDYLHRIADEDKRIANQVGAAKKRVRTQREETRTTRKRHRQETGSSRFVFVRRALCATGSRPLAAVSSQRRSSGSRTSRSLSAAEREHLAEMEALQQVSAELASKIQAAQAAAGTGGGPVRRRIHLAGVGARDKPLRLALGTDARRHRHRRRLRHPDPRRRSRNRDLRGVAGRLRQSHRYRPRRRDCRPTATS